MKTRRNVLQEIGVLFNNRLNNLLAGYENYGLEETDPHWHWLQQFSKGTGLDICCGDYPLSENGGVDFGFRLGSVLGYPFLHGDNLVGIDNESQDYVVTNYPEPFEYPIKALREWFRVLKHQGILAIVCVDADNPSYEKLPAGPLENKKRQSIYTKKTLKYYLEKVGFKNIEIEIVNNMIHAKCRKP